MIKIVVITLVSYTHLDVYKRQEVVKGLFAPVATTQQMASPVKKLGSRTTRPYSRRQFPPTAVETRGSH